jgi:hypothetical protein
MFTIMALERLRSKKGNLEEKKETSQSVQVNFKQAESVFQASCDLGSVEADIDGMIDVLTLYLKTETTFTHVPYWEKRAQFITISKPKSILDM